MVFLFGQLLSLVTSPAQLTVTAPPQLSLTVPPAAKKELISPKGAGISPEQGTVSPCGQLIRGGVRSLTVMSCEHKAELFALSVAR